MRPLAPLTPLLLLSAGLAACEPATEAPAGQAAHEAAPDRSVGASPLASEAAPPLSATGPAASIESESSDVVQMAAAVVRVDRLSRQGARTVKLFGVGGGDPAMNGLQTYLAVFRSSAEGWAVFQVGDVLDYRILSEARGRVDLELSESVMDQATGNIGSRTRRVIVGWPLAVDGSAPDRITVIPAR